VPGDDRGTGDRPRIKTRDVRTLGQSTLASELGVEGADEDDLYRAMDWLLERQDTIEGRLASRHLRDGEMVLYDVSSSYFEGRTCPLARLGYSRDGKPGLGQIIYGLVCDNDGRPVAVEVFTGELHDDQTVPAQITKLKDRFGSAGINESAGRNRHGAGDERALHRRSSDPRCPRVMRWRPARAQRSVDRGTCRLGY
jgi:hypothetical protein